MAEPFSAAAGVLWQMITRLIAGYGEGKQDLFDRHVEPLYQQMTRIHKDYISGFQEARRRLEDRNAPSANVIEFLRERRRDYDSERYLSRRLAEELARNRRLGIKGGTWELIEEFCQDIARYFNAGAGGANISWYTDFLDTVAFQAREGYDDPWFANAIEDPDPTLQLLRDINRTLDAELPKAFNEVTDAYVKLTRKLI